MKKKIFAAVLTCLILLSSCATRDVQTANKIGKAIEENRDLIDLAVAEMALLEKDRIYVAIEDDEDTDKVDPRLVSYEKESGDRSELENEILQETITKLGLALIFFQTASDGDQCVIFSYGKESAEHVVYGFYHSFSAEPCGWWGRKAELKKKDGKYLQIDKSGEAWYQTVRVEDSLYYFEKHGDLMA